MRKHLPLAAVLAVYVAIGVVFAVRIPAWQVPDEPGHYNYVKSLAQGVFPVIEPSDWDPKLVPIAPDAKNVPYERITYQDHQPPLFYALSVPVYTLSGGSLTALRIWSLLLGGIGVFACYATVLAIFPGRQSLAGAAAAVFALLPQHMHIMAGYNNDALSEALLGLTIWQSVRLMRAAPDISAIEKGALGLTVGLALFTKAQAYLALPIAGLTLLGTVWTDDSRWRKAFSRTWQFVLIAGLIALPLWLRNLSTYGGTDFLGLQAHNLAVTGQLTRAELISQVGLPRYLLQGAQTTFQSFWGQFGWMSVLPGARVYQALLAITFGTAALFMLWWLRDRGVLDPTQRRRLMLLALLSFFALLTYVWYNLQFVQFQGRYLYPALVAFAAAAALGWNKLIARWPRAQSVLWAGVLVIFAGMDMYMLLRVIGPGMG
jgi:4-amino-4-deoxy-L-arabinose transferase-like glycosyltransferase